MEEVLKKHGFAFKKRYGQNFISDENLLSAIVRDAGVDGSSTVLEIGAGAGALTRALSEKAKRVVSYEIDRTLRPVLEETLRGRENVELIFSDFSRADLAQTEAKLGEYVVVANLPYYVTTPILLRLTEESKTCRKVTVMVQEEVAARLCAREGTPEYGALTAAIARRGTVTLTRKVSRSLFTPRPNVDSAVVKIDFGEGGFSVEDPRAYRETVRCAFLNRRKTLENNLMGAFSLPRERAKALLGAVGVQEGARGETLSPERLGALSDLLVREGIIR